MVGRSWTVCEPLVIKLVAVPAEGARPWALPGSAESRMLRCTVMLSRMLRSRRAVRLFFSTRCSPPTRKGSLRLLVA